MKKAKHLRVDPFIKKTGKRIRALRMSKGMTMNELAAACNIEYAQVSNIERGVTNTSISHIYVIARELDTTVSRLFDF